MTKLLANILGQIIVLFAQLLTAVRPLWRGARPENKTRIYCGNHTSNGDFVLIWTALPPHIRRMTRPVAASDYWLTTKVRSFVIKYVFRAVLVDRNPETRTDDPIAMMAEATDQGGSLIIFPEGKRNMGDDILLPLKTGIYHLASKRPNLEFVPVWISNLNRAMPKGEIIPLPLLCSVSFGTPIQIKEGEGKEEFLERVRNGMLAIATDLGESND